MGRDADQPMRMVEVRIPIRRGKAPSENEENDKESGSGQKLEGDYEASAVDNATSKRSSRKRAIKTNGIDNGVEQEDDAQDDSKPSGERTSSRKTNGVSPRQTMNDKMPKKVTFDSDEEDELVGKAIEKKGNNTEEELQKEDAPVQSEDEEESSEDEAPEAVSMNLAKAEVSRRDQKRKQAIQEKESSEREKRKARNEKRQRQAEESKKRKKKSQLPGLVDEDIDMDELEEDDAQEASSSKLLPASLLEEVAGQFDRDESPEESKGKRYRKFDDSDFDDADSSLLMVPKKKKARKVKASIKKGPVKVKALQPDKRQTLAPKVARRTQITREQLAKGRNVERR